MRQIVLVCTFCYYSLVTNKQKAATILTATAYHFLI